VDRPLEGIRILSMEQAVALPFATRHLTDLGAEVIRVESHARARPTTITETDLARNKARWGLDLGVEGAPELFRQVAEHVDVVAHNFTPRVMRKFGLDFESIRAINPDVVYLSITGFGITGSWGKRPLFGPGAEAVSGHNLLIGEPDAWPGRPGTIVYADGNTGLNGAFAVLAALDHRDATGEAVHIDLSLYEASIAHLGVAVTERAFGSPLPNRTGNHDPRFLIHDVFTTRGIDRHVAIAASEDDRAALLRVLGLSEVTSDAIAAAVADRTAEDVAEALRMVPASDRFVYCAPGAVANVDMRGVAELLDEPRLTEERFQTAEGRMQNCQDYLDLFVPPFQRKTAQEWFEEAERLHLTFSLVQSVDDLFSCPQLGSRGSLRQVTAPDGRTVLMPGRPFTLEGGPPEASRPWPAVPGEHTQEVLQEWLA